MRSVVFLETPVFTRRIRELADDEDYRRLQVRLLLDPEAGDLIAGSGGLRKVRMAVRGRGKRGGARIIYYWIGSRSLIYLLLAATLFWSFINTPMDIINAGYSTEDWKVFGIIALISILIPYSLYYYGLKHIQSSKAIIISTLEPVIAIIAEWLFLNGRMGPLQIIGACSVISAIVLLQKDSRETEPIIVSE